MNKFQLYRLLRKNTNLSYKRSPAFEQNKWAKLLIYLGAGMFALYLIMYGCIVGMAAKGEAGMMLAFAPALYRHRVFLDWRAREWLQSAVALHVCALLYHPAVCWRELRTGTARAGNLRAAHDLEQSDLSVLPYTD